MKTESQIAKNDEQIKSLKAAVQQKEAESTNLDEQVKAPESGDSKDQEKWARGVFKNFHIRGAPLAFWFEERFVTLKSDEEVEVPMRMIEHLDANCKRVVRKTVRKTPDTAPGVMGEIVPVSYEKLYEFLIRETYMGPIW